LQNWAAISSSVLEGLARQSGKAKLLRAARLVQRLATVEEGELQ
jgi:hypothetical protein